MHFRLFNTLTKRIEDVRPADPARITFYSCGPTVYDDAHIGNFRSFLAADVLRRWLESPLCSLVNDTDASRQRRVVRHVMNITDVGHMTDDAEGGETGEDRMAVAGRRLLEAKKAGTLPAGVDIDPNDPRGIARYFEARFREDAVALGLKVSIEAQQDATLHPRASEHVPQMIATIQRLEDSGFAYCVGKAGERVVYFDVTKFPAYGTLSGNTLDHLREGEGGRVSKVNQASKRHPADFLLWKEDARHIMRWQSPWGEGYPGWHIECSAMSLERLMDGRVPEHADALIDVHSGGEDNIFPHHECEIAQTCCAFNLPGFARHWLHARFLIVNGEKMSKSKGNFFTPRDLFARGYEAAAVRLELIRTHYRSNADFREQGVRDGQRTIERARNLLDAGDRSSNHEPSAVAADAVRDFTDAMNDDINIARAIAALHTYMGQLETGTPTRGDSATLRAFDGVLNVFTLGRKANVATEIGVYIGLDPSPEVESLLSQRRDARARKDFAASDRIRDQLAAMRLAIKDMPGQRVEVRRS